MPEFDIEHSPSEVHERITAAFRTLFDMDEEASYDIGFHMTDWLTDLDELRDLYLRISSATDEEITSLLFKFLSHVPHHLNAAAKLSGLGPVTDVFGVGIFEEDE